MKSIIMKTEKAIYEASYKEPRTLGGGYYNLYLTLSDCDAGSLIRLII